MYWIEKLEKVISQSRMAQPLLILGKSLNNKRPFFTTHLKNELKDELGQSFTTAYLVLLIGGGPVFIENWECQSKTKVYDHMSNVRGQLKMISQAVSL